MVSVCIPNLNNREYLPERLDSILNQTYQDFEVVIVDNYSDDGAWELFEDYAKRDSRIRISQAPRNGMYANWNNTLHLARGEYVTVATSDDTMTPTFLEKMADALDKNPKCGLAHCCLINIDEKSDPILPNFWQATPFYTFNEEWLKKSHVRMAPLDGLSYMAFGCPYLSQTQIVVRKSVFEDIGLYRCDLGSSGDHEWTMRACLKYDTVHVPEYLATWRLHQQQATKFDVLRSERRKKFRKMNQMALDWARENRVELDSEMIKRLKNIYRIDQEQYLLREAKGALPKLKQFAKSCWQHPDFFWWRIKVVHIVHRNEPWDRYVFEEFRAIMGDFYERHLRAL